MTHTADHTADLPELRAAFVEPLRHATLDALLPAIRQACIGAGGVWQEPATATQSARPATHLFEVHLLGLTAAGFTATEAARNWRHAALAQIDATPERTAA